MTFEGPELSSQLLDWDAVADKEAASFVYQPKIIGGVKVEGGYEFQPDAVIPPPVVGCVMQNARACTGVEQDYMSQITYMEAVFGKEATLTRIQAARLLMDAMTGEVAEGMPEIIFVAETKTLPELTTPEFGMLVAPEGKTLKVVAGGAEIQLEPGKTYKDVTLIVE